MSSKFILRQSLPSFAELSQPRRYALKSDHAILAPQMGQSWAIAESGWGDYWTEAAPGLGSQGPPADGLYRVYTSVTRSQIAPPAGATRQR